MLDERYHFGRPASSSLIAAARELLGLGVFECLLDSQFSDSLLLEQGSMDLALLVTRSLCGSQRPGKPMRSARLSALRFLPARGTFPI